MVRPHPKIPQSELSGRLQTLMLLRVIFVSLLLGASIFIRIKETQTYFGYIQTSHFLLIITIYILTFIYIIILKYSKGLLWFAYFQLLVDTLFATAIMYVTGGIDSVFSFLYILTIFNGSIILYRKGGIIIASSSSILYGFLLDLQYYGIVHPLGARGIYATQYESFHLFYLILVNIAAFYLVAYLSSYLSEQARSSGVELKAKQIDIANLEVLNESIINSITSGLIALENDNKIILFNPAAEEIFGCRASPSFGRRIEEALPSLGDSLRDMQLLPGQGAKKPPPFIDLPYGRPDGQRIHIRLSFSPLRFSLGGQEGRILIFQDMTEIKRIEEEMKKVEALALIGEFAAGIAHEVRNPLASISGSIQMLRDVLDRTDVNIRLMDIVSREIDRLNHLVNDFLVFARPRKASLQEFDLKSLILEALELFKNSQHWSEKLEVITGFDDSTKLKSDPEQIKQVLWNVFLNASEAMPDGGLLCVATDLEPVALQPDQKRLRIVVRDTGCGFSEKALSQLFVPFFTTKEGGSGLGLPISKGIVEELGGAVWGSNHPEGGAQVTILLPVSS